MAAVKDKVAEKFMTPVFTENTETAKRIFAYQGTKVDMWKENPEQFELYAVGVFNMDTGEINSIVERTEKGACKPELICKLTDLIERS